MKTTIWTILLAALVVTSSLLAGIYIDLIVHKVASWGEIPDAFGVHVDFARPEKWQGYSVDQERTGEWKIHIETVDLTSFLRSNRVIGAATDTDNPPGWNVTGYVKSDAKYLVYTGEDVGAGLYLLKASSAGLRSKPAFSNTMFQGYSFGWNTDEKGSSRFRRCPYVLIRESDVQAFHIVVEDIKDILSPLYCDNLLFPNMRPDNESAQATGRELPAAPQPRGRE